MILSEKSATFRDHAVPAWSRRAAPLGAGADPNGCDEDGWKHAVVREGGIINKRGQDQQTDQKLCLRRSPKVMAPAAKSKRSIPSSATRTPNAATIRRWRRNRSTAVPRLSGLLRQRGGLLQSSCSRSLLGGDKLVVGTTRGLFSARAAPSNPSDHDDFGLNQSKVMNVIDSINPERDARSSLRNLRKPDRARKSRAACHFSSSSSRTLTWPPPHRGTSRAAPAAARAAVRTLGLCAANSRCNLDSRRVRARIRTP